MRLVSSVRPKQVAYVVLDTGVSGILSLILKGKTTNGKSVVLIK